MEASHEIYGSRLFVSWNCQMRGNLLIILICVVTPALSSTFSVPVNGSVTLPCTSEANYPTWYGPQLDGITDTPIPYSNAIGAFNSKLGEKRDRLSWDTNNKNLIISYVKRSDQGQYICREYIHNLEIRVAPQNPIISNTESVSPDKLIIRATQGLSHTLICTSTGGYPEPTVEWYRGSTTTSPLTSSKSTVHNTASDTYTVTQRCTIIPGSSDDGIQYYCQSKYDTEPTLQSSTSAELYLNLNPSIPTVSQLPTRVEGNTLQDIARCESSGFRPSTSLSLSWIFRGQTEVDTVTPTEDPASSAKFSVTSTYNKQVGRQDNGKQLTCSVNHSTLSSPVTGSTTVIVFYPPLTVTLSGDTNVIANGVNTISLTCTGSEANPVSSITWKSGNTIITSDKQISNPAGSYNGQSTIQKLSITPTRDMDGEQYKCEIKNNVSQTLTSQSKTLNLSYSPLVTITGPASNSITEGDNNLLSCSVNSKPTSTITWYHDNIQVSQATPGSNSLGYRLNPSPRTHYGVYRCTANNAINPENEKQISITVKFKPLTTTISGNNNIIANGQNSLSLICTSGESNPVSDITWKINSVTTTSTSSLADLSGQYGGKKRRQKLTLKPTRDNDGDRVTCEARNDYSLATLATITATLDLKFSPLIQTMHDSIVVEGNYSILHCEASSKPVSTFKWFKNGQGSVIHQAVGTSGSNRLSYTISAVMRTDAATYRCNADNGIQPVDNKQTVLTVQYPPDVNVVLSTTDISEGKELILTCDAKGVPSLYKYNSLSQTWGRSIIHSTHSAVSGTPIYSSLRIPSLQLQDSGTYTCRVNNGITNTRGVLEDSVDSVFIKVKVSPKIITQGLTFTGVTGGTANIRVEFYSYPDILNVTFKRYDGSVITNGGKYNVSHHGTEVTDKFHGTYVTLDGSQANLVISDLKAEHFGVYALTLSNQLSTTVTKVILVAESRPDEPTHFTYLYKDNTHTFSWLGGFNGGYAQTFVIQTSIVGTEDWINRATITEILPGVTSYQASTNALPPGTYVARIFAWTVKGTSAYVGLNYTFSSVNIESDPEIPTFPVAVVTCCVSTVIVVLIITTGVVVFYKMSYNQKDLTPSRSADRKSHNTTVEETSYYNVANQGDTNAQQSVKSGTVQENDLQDISTYEALDANNEDVSTYSSLTPTLERHEDTVAYDNLQLHKLST